MVVFGKGPTPRNLVLTSRAHTVTIFSLSDPIGVNKALSGKGESRGKPTKSWFLKVTRFGEMARSSRNQYAFKLNLPTLSSFCFHYLPVECTPGPLSWPFAFWSECARNFPETDGIFRESVMAGVAWTRPGSSG